MFFSLSLSSANAHDFWLQANNYHSVTAPVTVPVKFLVGHGDEVDAWSLNWDRIVALRTYSDGGYRDQLRGIVPNNALTRGIAGVSLKTEGTHILGFESYHSVSTLAAGKFNSYAEKEGLALVLSERKRLGQENREGKEVYSRKAKTLLQVGDNYTDNVTKPIGHMLEIVPLRNPYAQSETDMLPVQVLFRGLPLENALIDFASLAGDANNEQAKRTDKNGETSFKLVREGNWKINVIWSVPNMGSNDTEFETYFSSLTFGY